jgi:hypothetical protein
LFAILKIQGKNTIDLQWRKNLNIFQILCKLKICLRSFILLVLLISNVWRIFLKSTYLIKKDLLLFEEVKKARYMQVVSITPHKCTNYLMMRLQLLFSLHKIEYFHFTLYPHEPILPYRNTWLEQNAQPHSCLWYCFQSEYLQSIQQCSPRTLFSWMNRLQSAVRVASLGRCPCQLIKKGNSLTPNISIKKGCIPCRFYSCIVNLTLIFL